MINKFIRGETVTLPEDLVREAQYPRYLGIPHRDEFTPDSASNDIFYVLNMHIRRLGFPPKDPIYHSDTFALPGDSVGIDPDRPVPGERRRRVIVGQRRTHGERRYALPELDSVGIAPPHHAYTVEEAKLLESSTSSTRDFSMLAALQVSCTLCLSCSVSIFVSHCVVSLVRRCDV